ncbi:MAG: zf-HC2 domain-containing protein, partial [Planctomycetota bacterium]|nr:zf-HC2 domain-containing protein [Planctomycetota bacterium]
MPLSTDCASAQQEFRAYVEGSLTMNEGQALQAHLAGCARCQQALAEHKKMYNLMSRTIGAKRLDERFDRKAEERLRNTPDNVRLPEPAARPTTGMVPMPVMGGMEEGDGEEARAAAPVGFIDALMLRFGAAPWWMISGAFHALLLLLLTLIGMAVLRNNEKEIVILTNLEKRPEVQPEEKVKDRDVFKNPVPIETNAPVTDQTPIVTHEEVEVVDHVETANDADASETRGENGISDVMLGGTGTSAAIGVGGGGG